MRETEAERNMRGDPGGGGEAKVTEGLSDLREIAGTTRTLPVPLRGMAVQNGDSIRVTVTFALAPGIAWMRPEEMAITYRVGSCASPFAPRRRPWWRRVLPW